MKKSYRILSLLCTEFSVPNTWSNDFSDSSETVYVYRYDYRFPEDFDSPELAEKAMEKYFSSCDEVDSIGKTEFVIKEIFSKK